MLEVTVNLRVRGAVCHARILELCSPTANILPSSVTERLVLGNHHLEALEREGIIRRQRHVSHHETGLVRIYQAPNEILLGAGFAHADAVTEFLQRCLGEIVQVILVHLTAVVFRRIVFFFLISFPFFPPALLLLLLLLLDDAIARYSPEPISKHSYLSVSSRFW
jgi:hypothetical protein